MHKCQFPGCKYETEFRFQIHRHHIIPQEHENTNDNKNNVIFLCPNCHNKIFIEGTRGIHKIKADNSIILNRWMQSTGGRILEYIDSNGETQFHGEQ